MFSYLIYFIASRSANVCANYITYLSEKKYERIKTFLIFALDLNQ